MEDLMLRVSHRSLVAMLAVALTAPTSLSAGPAARDAPGSCSDGPVLRRACYDVSARTVGRLRGTVAWLDHGRVLQVLSADARMCGLDEPPPQIACPGDAIVTLDDDRRPGQVPQLVGEALRRDAERTATLRWQLHLLELQDEQLMAMVRVLDARQPDHAPPREPERRAQPAAGPYLPIAQIHPGQLRKSDLNVRAKVRRAIERHIAVERGGGATSYELGYDHGHSILPPDEPLPVIKGPPDVGYVLVDGHHDVLASLALGATTVPVQQVADLSELSEADFWERAARDGYVYPYAIGGQRETPPRRFDDLVDDPNRYFAAVTARMCKTKGDDAGRSLGAEYPLWVKIGRDVPFIEFKISDRLTAAHFDYGATKAYQDDPADPPSDVVARARAILVGEPRVDGLRVVPARVPYMKIPDLCSTQPGVLDVR
jgi:hypothetical protein